MLDPAVQRRYGLKFYMRMKDDIFFILRRSPHRRDFIQDWQAQGRHSDFVIDKWECSTHSVCALDLEVMIQPGSKKLDWAPYVKETPLGVPLGPHSAHEPGIHRSWPHAEHFRLARNSSSHQSYLVAKQVVLDRLIEYAHLPSVISRIQEVDAFRELRTKSFGRSLRLSVSGLVPGLVHAVTERTGPSVPPIFWRVLPSHPLWHRLRFVSFLHRIGSDPDLAQLWQAAWRRQWPASPCIRVAWRNSVRHLQIALRAIR